MRLSRLALLLIVVLALVAGGCSGSKTDSSPGPGPGPGAGEATDTTEVPAVEETPTVESLAGLQIKDLQESLVFDYLRAGGVAALQGRFGKPTATYKTAADESSTGSAELADGRFYLIQCGTDAKGAALVMAHSVEAKQGQSATQADKDFVSKIVDGKTTMADANAYLRKVGGTVQEATLDPAGLSVPAYVWSLKDGDGFIVVDLTALTAQQMADIDMADSGPWQALYWDAARWRAY